MFDITEGAGARTNVTEHQKRCSTAAPAFAQIRAHGFFADRVPLLLAHQSLQPLIGLAGGGADLDPIRTAQWTDISFGNDPVSRRCNRHKVLFDVSLLPC